MYGKCECFVMQMLYVCVHHVAVLNAAFCHGLCSVVYFRSRLLVYSAGSGVNRV